MKNLRSSQQQYLYTYRQNDETQNDIPGESTLYLYLDNGQSELSNLIGQLQSTKGEIYDKNHN